MNDSFNKKKNLPLYFSFKFLNDSGYSDIIVDDLTDKSLEKNHTLY